MPRKPLMFQVSLIISTRPDSAAQKMGVKPLLSLISRFAPRFSNTSVADILVQKTNSAPQNFGSKFPPDLEPILGAKFESERLCVDGVKTPTKSAELVMGNWQENPEHCCRALLPMACTWLLGYLAQLRRPPKDSDDSGPRDMAVSCGVENCGLQPRVHVIYCTPLLKEEFAPHRVPCTEWYHM